MASHGYEEVDHTADIALRVWAEDFQGMLRQAASGVYDLMGVTFMPGSQIEMVFELLAGTQETILVDFLSELLYLVEEKGQVCEGFSFIENEDVLIVRTKGYRVHKQERNIKAVTYHNLNVELADRGLEATITFDV